MEPTAVAEQALVSWTASATTSTAGPDLGPAVLATLVADRRVEGDAVRAWLRTGTRCAGTVALHGGMGAVLAGLRLLASRRPDFAPAAERTAASVASAGPRWRDRRVGFLDYDLVGGPAGLLLAHRVGDLPAPPERTAAAAAHLAGLAAHPGLARLRIGAHEGHPLLAWSQHGIVTGLAHGVAGPLAALSMMDEPPVDAVRNLAEWLVALAERDALGVVSWPRRGDTGLGAGVVRRQAWCYGTPGVAWALFTAGRAVTRAGRPEGEPLCDEARAAMASLCAAYDPEVHLGAEPLGISTARPASCSWPTRSPGTPGSSRRRHCATGSPRCCSPTCRRSLGSTRPCWRAAPGCSPRC